LLGDVLAHAPEGGLLVTLRYLNVIAVASHAELPPSFRRRAQTKETSSPGGRGALPLSGALDR
jgi:hypothetical protein